MRDYIYDSVFVEFLFYSITPFVYYLQIPCLAVGPSCLEEDIPSLEAHLPYLEELPGSGPQFSALLWIFNCLLHSLQSSDAQPAKLSSKLLAKLQNHCISPEELMHSKVLNFLSQMTSNISLSIFASQMLVYWLKYCFFLKWVHQPRLFHWENHGLTLFLASTESFCCCCLFSDRE